jgi:hypothetical protein
MSPDIDAIYLYTGPGWTYKQDGNECPEAPADGTRFRHFLRSPAPRLAKGRWAQIKVTGRKMLASTTRGQQLEDSYKLSGYVTARVSMSKGDFDSIINLTMDVDALPF